MAFDKLKREVLPNDWLFNFNMSTESVPPDRGGLAPNLGPGPIHRERAPKIKLSLLESPKLFVAPLFYTGLKGYWNIAIKSN